jgi:hypothetical protein
VSITAKFISLFEQLFAPCYNMAHGQVMQHRAIGAKQFKKNTPMPRGNEGAVFFLTGYRVT